MMNRLLSMLVLYTVLLPPAWAVLPLAIDNQPLPSLAPILERSMPAVVNISTSTEVKIREHPLLQDPFFRHFFQLPNQPRKRRHNSLGSGVIVDSQHGYVLTNNHVIDKADTINVTLQDGRQFEARLVGKDPEADVAVIQIDADRLTALPIGNSDQLRVGDFVVAVGNPFGLGQTVTSGIVSALGRSGLGIEGYEDFIQTDASINPGNSGGALINLKGELVGMNTAILAPSGGNVGIGFAIPANMAITLMNTLIEHGEVRRGLLGVVTQDLTPELRKAFNLNNSRGVVVSKVEGHSPAARAGLEPGDVIVEFNGETIKNSHQIRNIVGMMQIGDQARMVIYRGDKQLKLTATIDKAQLAQIDGEQLHPLLKGVSLSDSAQNQIEGVLIEKIHNRSYAWQAGLRPGDIFISANRYRVRNLGELKQVINPKAPLLLNVQRGDAAFFLMLK
ncbi:MAG: DegQ family serine endoprotease [Methylococcales bacterium]|nr:DegQ family serine endoprotease [Methylococcales bacterium]